MDLCTNPLTTITISTYMYKAVIHNTARHLSHIVNHQGGDVSAQMKINISRKIYRDLQQHLVNWGHDRTKVHRHIHQATSVTRIQAMKNSKNKNTDTHVESDWWLLTILTYPIWARSSENITPFYMSWNGWKGSNKCFLGTNQRVCKLWNLQQQEGSNHCGRLHCKTCPHTKISVRFTSAVTSKQFNVTTTTLYI